MIAAECNMDSLSVQKLLSAGSGDAALVYLYIQSGNPEQQAREALRMPAGRYECAVATLRQLGLWPEKKPQFIQVGERPVYSEKDVLTAIQQPGEFRKLYEEIQRLLGRTLNTEELKIILSFVRYLGLPADVICVLVCYCKDRAKQRGSLRNPSLRTIEKEAYAWAEQGIDTMEEAGAFIQRQNMRRGRMQELMDILQIRDRTLTAGEERYAQSWLDMNMDKSLLLLAYERTCLNTGRMNWAYMNSILSRWHEAGYRSAEQVKAGDKKPAITGASGQLGQAELEAIQRVLQEG